LDKSLCQPPADLEICKRFSISLLLSVSGASLRRDGFLLLAAGCSLLLVALLVPLPLLFLNCWFGRPLLFLAVCCWLSAVAGPFWLHSLLLAYIIPINCWFLAVPCAGCSLVLVAATPSRCSLLNCWCCCPCWLRSC